MTALIDGHNAIHRLGLRTGSHEGDRRALLARVRRADPQAEVYFDARQAPPRLPDLPREGGLRVRYVRGREADDAILDRVRSAERPGDLVVVTDDRELAGGARQLGARTLPVREFLGEDGTPAQEPPPPGAGGFRPEDFGLPGEVDLRRPPSDLRRGRSGPES
jgi:hypothetical protein